MDDRRKTIAALTLITGFVILIVVVFGVVMSRGKILSPVPDESVIRVIFISPTPVVVSSPTAVPTEVITKKPTPTKKPVVATGTPKPTIATTPTLSTTPTTPTTTPTKGVTPMP